MSYGLTDQLEEATRLIQEVAKSLEDSPEHEKSQAAKFLIEKCEIIEERYKEYCEECDDSFGYEPGTSYKEGVNMEFYIESSDWHQISLALRVLAK